MVSDRWGVEELEARTGGDAGTNRREALCDAGFQRAKVAEDFRATETHFRSKKESVKTGAASQARHRTSFKAKELRDVFKTESRPRAPNASADSQLSQLKPDISILHKRGHF